MERLAEWVRGLNREGWQLVFLYKGDTLHPEIRPFERVLAKAPTQPFSTICNPRLMTEPVTEQQRIIDLAG
jgi:hypothetical protein